MYATLNAPGNNGPMVISSISPWLRPHYYYVGASPINPLFHLSDFGTGNQPLAVSNAVTDLIKDATLDSEQRYKSKKQTWYRIKF